MKKIALLIRRDVNYYLDSSIDNRWRDNIPFSLNLKGWKLFFKMPYLDFRKKIAKVSLENFFNNNFDRIYFWQDLKSIQENGLVIVAIDEDDWIHPDLCRNLRDFDFLDKKVVRWDVINIDRRGHSFIERNRIMRSCGYATKLPFDIKCISTNVFMSRRIKESSKINKPLSVKIDNISSLSYLYSVSFSEVLNMAKARQVVEKTDLLKDYHDLVDKYNDVLLEFYDSCKI